MPTARAFVGPFSNSTAAPSETAGRGFATHKAGGNDTYPTVRMTPADYTPVSTRTAGTSLCRTRDNRTAISNGCESNPSDRRTVFRGLALFAVRYPDQPSAQFPPRALCSLQLLKPDLAPEAVPASCCSRLDRGHKRLSVARKAAERVLFGRLDRHVTIAIFQQQQGDGEIVLL
jgi:hypothetical protein